MGLLCCRQVAVAAYPGSRGTSAPCSTRPDLSHVTVEVNGADGSSGGRAAPRELHGAQRRPERDRSEGEEERRRHPADPLQRDLRSEPITEEGGEAATGQSVTCREAPQLAVQMGQAGVSGVAEG